MIYPSREKHGEEKDDHYKDNQAASKFRLSLHGDPIHYYQGQLLRIFTLKLVTHPAKRPNIAVEAPTEVV